jgi:L-threonylcarbamoyladenylate synthase
MRRAPAQKTRAHDPKKILEIARGLRAGAVAIFPTETVYGLGTSAFATLGIQKIYRLKGRHWRKPLAILVPTLEAALPLVEEIPPEARRLAKAYCPGPLTFVLKASDLGRMVTGGVETIGVRVPDHPIALALLRAVQIPLATTSVNRSGDPPAVSGRRAAQIFGKEVEWFLEGGVCRVKAPSSVVDFSHYPFTVAREGAVSKKELEKFLEGRP